MAPARHTCVAGPFVVLLAGGIASGKSTVARLLEERGALRIDLDALTHEVYEPGSAVLARIADAFGADVLSKDGTLVRSVLAQRAFASPESTRLLESLVHPAVHELLMRRLREVSANKTCVVEVPLLDRVEDLIPLASEVVCVTCPLEVRRERARLRGVEPADFDARVALQPSDDYLRAHATAVLNNDGDEQGLRDQVNRWWAAHDRGGNEDYGHA